MEKYKLLARKMQLAANRQTSGESAILILSKLRWWNGRNQSSCDE
jgi:hypothetical protein